MSFCQNFAARKLLLAGLLLLPWQLQAQPVDQPQLSCDFGEVLFDISFASARLNSCKQTDNHEYSLSTAPENAPVNPSPWYAFRVFSERERNLTIYLNYSLHGHRYVPKLSADGQSWQPIDEDDIEILFDGKTAKMELRVGPQGLWVAAQEIMDNSFYDDYTGQLDQLPFLQRSVLGESLEGRPVYKIESANPASRYILLVGRQHPPEVTGAIGMAHFINRLAANDSLATAFRAEYGLIMVPNMNPDGVERGFWRHSFAGVDLNRDWGPFTQPETALVREELRRFEGENGPQISLFLDFHSTDRDVFYTNSEEMRKLNPQFTENWMANIQQRMQAKYPDYQVEETPGYNPLSAVSKNWMNQYFGIPAITFEYGDESDRQQIRDLSEVAAEEMMRLMLNSLAQE